MQRFAAIFVATTLALGASGCGGSGNKPKLEVLKSANPLTADLYVRVTGPTGVVNYIAGRLTTGTFTKYGLGIFLPPHIRRHHRQRVCSITHTIGASDSPSVQGWRGKTARITVFGGGASSAIFCQIVPALLAPDS
jgi:hypothetical protein